MLGPAELRLIDETLREASAPAARRSPYISPGFAAGLAVARAVARRMRAFGGAEKSLPANDLP